MKFPFRRKPLALLVCCGFSTTFAGGFVSEAQAQTSTPDMAPLRVDPTLLGLPPSKPVAVPAPAPAETPRAEVKPVEAPLVEVRPVEAEPEASAPTAGKAGRASPRNIPARAAAPQEAAAVAAPALPPVAPASATPVLAAPTRNPRDEARRANSTALPQQAMAPLRVDPALLGQAPAKPIELAAPADWPRSAAADSRPAPAAEGDQSWFRRLWSPLDNAYRNGALELYLPLRTHHLRSAYSAEKIATFQENPWGLGIGRGLYNEKGDWEGVYAMGFQDSHFQPQWMAGYGWKTFWHPLDEVRLGLGYTAFLAARADIAHYAPIPGILPLASLGYKNLNLEASFVPGAKGNGNILFIWAKWEFGKSGEAIGTPASPGASGQAPALALSTGPAAAPGTGSVAGRYAGSASAPQSVAPSATHPLLVAAGAPRDAEEVPSDLPPLRLRLATAMVAPPAKSDGPLPVFLSAQQMSGDVEREAVAEGAAELRNVGTVVDADRMTYWPLDDELDAAGNVRIVQGEDVVTGPHLRLKLEDQIGFFEQPTYFLKHQPAEAGPRPAPVGLPTAGFAPSTPPREATEGHGHAERMDFEGVNQIRLTAATYSTCKPGNDDWYAKASDLKLDYDREVAEGGSGTIYFMDVPILYSPWMSFSLNHQRKSGFLAPTLGSTSKSGLEFTLPYYWNIAPNMDATVAPRVLTKRGVQLNTEFRYLDANYSGQAQLEMLPDDKLRKENRYGFSLQHAQNLGHGFAGAINYNKVSDDNYYTDLSSRIAVTSQTQLLQQGMLTYGGGGWWSATANVQSYQTLQPDPANPVATPYRLLPQLTVTARQPDLYRTDSSFLGQFTSFSHPTLVEGRRTVLYPQVAIPFETPGWYVTPKFGVHATQWSLDRQTLGTPDSLSRTLPVFSIDAGMTFERPSNLFGRDYTQTLEPRLFYLNVPFRDQSNIPIFDSGLADFNFAQIFAENQFTGQDRFNDANQLTAAVTSRLIEPATGREVMRAMLGQRLYFRNQEVTLPGQAQRIWNRSDFLAAFSGQVLPKVYADAALQYSPTDAQTQRLTLGGRYLPEPGKVLNMAYRFNRDLIKQVDVSVQWPIYGGWYAVGRTNYSLKDKQPIENIAGLEYNGGCWVARLVGQRLATTSGTASSALFFQLELNDFSQIGSNPLDLLKRSIQGYGKINQSTADPVFGQ